MLTIAGTATASLLRLRLHYKAARAAGVRFRERALASTGQQTGMRGVYLVAAELSRLGLIASPTSRSAIGADVLVTDHLCSRSFSVQVKTNAKTFNFWVLQE